MNKIFSVLFLLIFVSCVSKRIPYEPEISITNENAKAIIEQVLTEQPTKYAPASTIIAEEYIEMNYGMQTRSHGSSGGVIIIDGLLITNNSHTETTKELKKRIYYNSILEARVFIRGSWFVLQVVDTERRIIHNFYCRNELKAKKFADALMSLKNNVTNTLEK